MKKQKLFKIDCGTYPFDILVDIGNSDADVKKWLNKHGCGVDDDEFERQIRLKGGGKTVTFVGNQMLIRINGNMHKHVFFAVLAHEIAHAVISLFDKIGMRVSMDTEEAFAYQTEYITLSIMRNIK